MNNSDWLHWEANAEDGAMHREPSEEVQFFRAVAAGDLDAVRSSCERRRFGDHSGMGVLSRDPLTDIKYHFVIAAAMIARFCAQQGMEVEQALRLSDYYIGKLDDITARAAVLALHTEMAMDYAAKMRRLSREAGLFTWDKPAYACLATRIPTGEAISRDMLERVEQAEDALARLGYRDFRVRVCGGAARLQLTEEELARAFGQREEITRALRPWFPAALLDLEPRQPSR